ncbi:hypothetical protein KQI52_04735 [bacterium]|nr:hypothetical protein [bacterium]
MIRRLFLIFLCAVSFADLGLGQELRWPPEDPENWLLAFVDVETTGLQPGYHELVDIGLIYSDLKGRELGRLFERVMPEHPERTSPEAASVNGFSVERWDTLQTISAAELVQRITSFHNDIVKDNQQVILIAFNSWFDASFLEATFSAQESSVRSLYFYYVLDVPSMAWAVGMRGLSGANLAAELGIEDEPHEPLLHTGITGADLNLRVYRALRERAVAAGLW